MRTSSNHSLRLLSVKSRPGFVTWLTVDRGASGAARLADAEEEEALDSARKQARADRREKLGKLIAGLEMSELTKY